VAEPLGGAHRDPVAVAATVKDAILRHLNELQLLSTDQLLARRSDRLASFGVYSETKA
jgi:acetyl-CoA carboxylase carboxyl transferase subunit alpha